LADDQPAVEIDWGTTAAGAVFLAEGGASERPSGSMTDHRAVPGEARDQAAQWVVRIAAEAPSEADLRAFDAWISAAPAHAEAYDEALATWLELGRNAGRIVRDLAARKRDVDRKLRRGVVGLAAAAAAVAAIALLPQLGAPAALQTYATGVGEHRTVTLADGSRIDLNAATRMTVRLGRRERQVALQQGEAVFDVAHDARRPFLVAAGDRQVRVVGTQFDVRRRGGRLSVTVARGAVEVLPAAGAAGAAFRLHPGQRLDKVEGRPQATVAAVEPRDAFAWRTGRLIYRGQPLSDVVADLNAQFPRPIRIADPRLAAEPISGVLVLDDEDAVARRLALLVSAQAVPSDGGVILQREETP
jgi:transmembrane sensor